MNDVDPFLRRVRHELGASFAADRPVTHATVHDPIDVIGGFSDYAGATVLSTISDCRTHVAVQSRDDAQVQVFSFDLYDAHRPFTLVAPVEAIVRATDDQLRAHFADANAAWAGVAVGVVRSAITSGAIGRQGVSIAIQSNATSPAAMLTAVARAVEPLCAGVSMPFETWVADVSRASASAIRPRDVLTCAYATAGTLVRIKCQPCERVDAIEMPPGVVHRSLEVSFETDAWRATTATLRAASAMGHRLILDKIRQMGLAAGRELIGDPTGGYLSNLSLNDYRRYFRPYLPESIKGGSFLIEHRGVEDADVHIHPDTHYPVQAACDFHIFSANRVATFADCINSARTTTDPTTRDRELNKAGHLLYATQASLATDAGLECVAADAIGARVRQQEHAGYYGASLTPTGVTILQDMDARPLD